MRNRGFNKTHEKQTRESSFRIELPEIEPLNFKTGLLVTGGVAVIGIGIGAAIGTQVFFGAASLIGLVMLIESNKYIKYIVIKGNVFIDVAIFLSSIYAVASLGVTLAGALMFAGLGYTGVIAPWYRTQDKKRRKRGIC